MCVQDEGGQHAEHPSKFSLGIKVTLSLRGRGGLELCCGQLLYLTSSRRRTRPSVRPVRQVAGQIQTDTAPAAASPNNTSSYHFAEDRSRKTRKRLTGFIGEEERCCVSQTSNEQLTTI